MFTTVIGNVNTKESKNVITQLIEAKGEHEAFKYMMQVAMRSYAKKYPNLNKEELSEMAYNLTEGLFKQAEIGL